MTYFLLFLLVGVHDYHVSTTHIHYNPETSQLEISTKLFYDDLQRAIDPAKEKCILDSMNSSCNTLLSTYLADHLHMQAEKEVIEIAFLGYEIEEEAVWVYLQAPVDSNFTELQVSFTALNELFEDQTHMIYLDKGRFEESMILHKDRISDKVVLSNSQNE